MPRIVTIGAGCRKGVSAEAFERFILKQLSEKHVAVEAVEQLASIELKKNEACILAFCDKYKIPFVTYTAEELQEVQGNFPSSNLVKSVTEMCIRDRNLTAHFTASAWILNETGTKVLMVYHNIYDSWSWTGGHADGEADLAQVALREAKEETGLSQIEFVKELSLIHI